MQQFVGLGDGWSTLVHNERNNAGKKGKTAIVEKCRHLSKRTK